MAESFLKLARPRKSEDASRVSNSVENLLQRRPQSRTTTMPIRCIVHFAQAHPEFRLPELESVAELYGFKFSRPSPTHSFSSRVPPEVPSAAGSTSGSTPTESEEVKGYEWDPKRPFWVVDFDSEEHVRLVCERCILVKCACFTSLFPFTT